MPDLTFSEMNFLNHRKPEPKDNVLKGKQGRQRRDKAADGEAEISRFFASSKDPNHQAGVTVTENDRGDQESRTAKRRRRQESSSIPPVDLPDKPFLGFGSCGPGHVSSTVHENNLGQLSPLGKSPYSRSTTYFTWSQSDFSRHPSSRHRSQSGRPLSETHLRPFLVSESPAGSQKHILSTGVERNFREETPNPSPTYHAEKRHHEGRDCNTSGPAIKSDRPSIASVERQETKVNEEEPSKRRHEVGKIDYRQSPRLQHGSSPKTALSSLLAGQNRPELLGAFLDALLSRVTNNSTEKTGGPGPLDTPGGKRPEDRSVPRTTADTQMQHQSNHPSVSNELRSNSNAVNKPEVTARPNQAREPCQPQPLDSNTLPSSTRLPSHASYMEPPSRLVHESLEPGKEQGTQRHGIGHDQGLQTAAIRPTSDNAWTGYRNLYQGQLDPVFEHHQPYEDTVLNDAETRLQKSGHLFEQTAEAPDRGALDGYDRYPTSEEHQPSESCLDHQHIEAEGVNQGIYDNPEVSDGMDVLSQWPQEMSFDSHRHGQVPVFFGATDPTSEHLEDIAADQDFGVGEETFQGRETPSFLGAKGFLAVDPHANFSPWSARRHQAARDSRRGPSTCDITADVGAAEEAPPSGFWKPHRLY